MVTESPFGPPGSTLGADGTISGSHVYADNGTYTVTVTITDDEGAFASDTLTITVNNVAPTVEAGSDQTINEGQTVSLDPAAFNDLGTLDTHTATIDWGDGTSDAGVVTESPFGPPGSGSTLGADGTVAGSHVYADDGVYTVTVTVTDDENDSGSDTLTITVVPPVAIKNSIIDELEAAKIGDTKVDKKIDKTIKHIKKSLNQDLWIDNSHLDLKHGQTVFNEEKQAARILMPLMDKKNTPEALKDACLIAIAKLIEADDILVKTIYDKAQDLTGEPKVDKELEKCEKEFEKVDKELAKENYHKAVDHYKHAWEHVQKAIKHANV